MRVPHLADRDGRVGREEWNQYVSLRSAHAVRCGHCYPGRISGEEREEETDRET